MLSQNLKSWENETNRTRNRPNLWQQQMWQFRFGIRQIYKGSPWTRQQEFLILIHSSGITVSETPVNPGMCQCMYAWEAQFGWVPLFHFDYRWIFRQVMSMGLKQLVVNWRILIVKKQKLVKRIPLLPKFMVNLETNDHHHQLYIFSKKK